VVLVSWEHKAIHQIVTGLGGPRSPDWPDDRFDMVFVLDRTGAGWDLTQVPQMLLAGDSDARFG
jgi:hypothetical protein